MNPQDLDRVANDITVREDALNQASDWYEESERLNPHVINLENGDKEYERYKAQQTELNTEFVEELAARFTLPIGGENRTAAGVGNEPSMFSPWLGTSTHIGVTRPGWKKPEIDSRYYELESSERLPLLQRNVLWLAEGWNYPKRVRSPADDFRHKVTIEPEPQLFPYFIVGSKSEGDKTELILLPAGEAPPIEIVDDGSGGKPRLRHVNPQYSTRLVTVLTDQWRVAQAASEGKSLEFANGPRVKASTQGSMVGRTSFGQAGAFRKANISPKTNPELRIIKDESHGVLELTDEMLERYGVLDHLGEIALALGKADVFKQEIAKLKEGHASLDRASSQSTEIRAPIKQLLE